jgi:hypothetical protein
MRARSFLTSTLWMALTLGGLAPSMAQTPPTPPQRPHGLAPETPLREATPLRDAPLRGGAKPQRGAPPAEAGATRPAEEKSGRRRGLRNAAPPASPPAAPQPARIAQAQDGAWLRDALNRPPVDGGFHLGPADFAPALAANAAAPAKTDAAPTPPERPAVIAATPPAPPPSDACLVELTALGADAAKAHAPSASDARCVVDAPVRLKSVTTREGKVVIHGEPLVSCEAARAAAAHLVQTVAPMAKGATGVALAGVTAAGFECRPRNRTPGGKLSAHGMGKAFDIMAFQFADGSSFTVAAPGERAAFLNGARKAACGYFTTVLGPGSDEAHRDHLHLDIEAHGAAGHARICQ